MSKLSRKVVAVGLTLTTAVWLAGAVLPASAQTSAATIAQLMAQIQALQSQLQALQGSASTQSSSYSFTRDLTLGSKGADVTALQQFLVSGAYLQMPAGVAYGYFGSLTQAAVVRWQGAAGVYPTAGYFGPKSRAAIALAVGTGTGTGTGGVVVSGPSSVALSPMNVANTNVPINVDTTHFEVVPVLTVRFTAGPAPLTVTGFNVQRSGLSSDQDLANVYLLDGSKIVTTNISMNNGLVQFSNAAGLFTVNAGTYKDITVAVSISSSATASGHTYQFSVPSAASITTAGATTVGGVFPIMSNTMTAASVTNLGGVTVTNGSAGITAGTALSVNAGQAKFNAGVFTLQANNQAVSVKSITLTNTASLGPSDLANVTLYNGATQVGTAQAIGGANQVTFDLTANPLQLSAGQSVQLFLYTDIVGGVNRYFQFSVQHNYDIVATDMMYNIGFLPAMNTGNFPMNLSYVSVQQGTLTLTRDFASPVNYVLPGGTNQTIAKFDFVAGGEAVKITQLNAVLNTTANVTNLKVIDDQGTQIGTTQATVATTTSYTNLNYLIPSGTKRVVSIILDVGTNFSGTLTGTLNNIAGQGYTSLATVPSTGTLSSTGNTLSVSGSILSAGLNSAMGNTNVVSGQVNARIGSFTLTAGPSSGVNVSNFQFTTAAASYDPASKYQNVRLMYGNTQVGNTQNVLTNGGTITFSAAQPILIPAGGQVILDVYGDVKTGAGSGTSTPGIVTLATNGVSATAVATTQSVSTVTGTPTPGQTVFLVAAGTLAFNAGSMPGTTAGATQIGMGVTGVKLASYQLTGSPSEAITLNNVYLTSTSSLTGAFTNFRLMNGATQLGSALSPSQSSSPYTVTWVGLNLPISQGGTLTLDVVADANTYSALSQGYTTSSNTTTTVSIYQLDYQGTASNQTASVTGTAVYGNTFVAVRNTLTAALASVPLASSVSDAASVAGFAFTAGNAAGTQDPAYLKSIAITQIYSGLNSSSTIPVTYHVLVNGQQVATATSTTPSGGSATLTLSQGPATSGGPGGTAGLIITKGTSQTLTITADLSSSLFTEATQGVKGPYQIKMTNYTWSDGTMASINADPNNITATNPLYGSSAALQF